jgi:hypothetical protein
MKRKTTVNTPSNTVPANSDKAALLRKLALAADEARSRVSTYSDEKRSELEQWARGVVSGAKAKQVCSR